MTDQPQNSQIGMGLLALCLFTFGLFMFLHGLGAVDASWFRPNPKTPQWVFSAIGVVLMLSGVLAAAQAVTIPKFIFSATGWVVVALAMVLAHWLVFYSEGASCKVAGGGVVIWISGIICYGVASIVLGLFDLIFVLIIVTGLWRRLT